MCKNQWNVFKTKTEANMDKETKKLHWMHGENIVI